MPFLKNLPTNKVSVFCACLAYGVLLTGCVSPQEQARKEYFEGAKKAQEEAKIAVEECNNKRKRGEYKTRMEAAECSNPKIIEAYEKANFLHIDLMRLLTAKRLELAEKMDQMKVSDAQGNLELAQFIEEIREKERKRDMEMMQLDSQAAVQRAAAAAMILGAMPTYQPAPVQAAPLPTPAPIRTPVTTNCTAMQQFLNCRSY